MARGPLKVNHTKDRNLAAEFHDFPGDKPKYWKPEGYGAERITNEKGQFVKGNVSPSPGRKKGGNNETVKAIKQYMSELLDNAVYRRGLSKRIKAGELPGIELFLLTKALGKPKEEIEITANVPLFALPTSFILQEDVVEAEDVKMLGEGDENGEDTVRK